MANKKKKIVNAAKRGYKIAKGGIKAIDGMSALYKAIRNHPEWYENYPLDGLTQLNFGQRELGRGFDSITVGSRKHISAPDSVITVDLVCPVTRAGSSPLWEATQILMNKLRAASGSNITYDIYDLAKYVLDTRELLALYASIKRIILALRIVDTYDGDSPYKYAIMASGTNLASPTLNQLTVNLASDTARMNRLTGVISNMIPLNIDLHHRTAWMFSNIFADSKTKKFSTKMFVSKEFSVYNIDRTGLTPVLKRNASEIQTTLTDRITQLEQGIGTFMNNVQNSRIAGDILKAFGPTAFMPVVGITEEMRIAPLYDEPALTQIQNATFFRPLGGSTTVGPDVETSPNSTTVQYTGVTSLFAPQAQTALNTAKIVNTYNESVGPSQVLSLTRLVSLVEQDPDTATTYKYVTCGTEVATCIQWVVSYDATGGGAIVSPLTAIYPSTNTDITGMCWSIDDWAPEIIGGTQVTIDGVSEYPSMFDLSNWAVAKYDDLSDYHALATLSLLATPRDIQEQSKFNFVL